MFDPEPTNQPQGQSPHPGPWPPNRLPPILTQCDPVGGGFPVDPETDPIVSPNPCPLPHPGSTRPLPHPYPLTECDPVGCSLSVDPEPNPRDGDEQRAGDVDVDDEVAHVTTQRELGVQRRHGRCGEREWGGSVCVCVCVCVCECVWFVCVCRLKGRQAVKNPEDEKCIIFNVFFPNLNAQPQSPSTHPAPSQETKRMVTVRHCGNFLLVFCQQRKSIFCCRVSLPLVFFFLQNKCLRFCFTHMRSV